MPWVEFEPTVTASERAKRKHATARPPWPAIARLVNRNTLVSVSFVTNCKSMWVWGEVRCKDSVAWSSSVLITGLGTRRKQNTLYTDEAGICCCPRPTNQAFTNRTKRVKYSAELTSSGSLSIYCTLTWISFTSKLIGHSIQRNIYVYYLLSWNFVVSCTAFIHPIRPCPRDRLSSLSSRNILS
jgi:hypothetical protein